MDGKHFTYNPCQFPKFPKFLGILMIFLTLKSEKFIPGNPKQVNVYINIQIQIESLDLIQNLTNFEDCDRGSVLFNL